VEWSAKTTSQHQEHTVNANQHRSSIKARRIVTTLSTTIATAGLVAALGTLPAAARQDPGPAPTEDWQSAYCPLERVDTQFVACDNLTGNGVPAPSWVPER
jgi:hypothetical protein